MKSLIYLLITFAFVSYFLVKNRTSTYSTLNSNPNQSKNIFRSFANSEEEISDECPIPHLPRFSSEKLNPDFTVEGDGIHSAWRSLYSVLGGASHIITFDHRVYHWSDHENKMVAVAAIKKIEENGFQWNIWDCLGWEEGTFLGTLTMSIDRRAALKNFFSVQKIYSILDANGNRMAYANLNGFQAGNFSLDLFNDHGELVARLKRPLLYFKDDSAPWTVMENNGKVDNRLLVFFSLLKIEEARFF